MKASALELVSLVAGEVSVEALASRHGATAAEVEGWRAAYLEGLRAGAAARTRGHLRARWLAAALAIVATAASAQLTVFAPNTPALASQVNGNFTQLKAWLEQKVGAVGSGDVTSANVSATGTVSGGSLTTAGGLTASGSSTLGGAGTTLNVLGTVTAFGTATTVAIGAQSTPPVAGTDGFVSVLITSTGSCNTGPAQVFGKAGAGLPVRQQASVHSGCTNQDYPTPNAGFVMPVRKGEPYQVEVSGMASVSAVFVPLGR